MLLFLPILHELNCINGSGQILGKISFDVAEDKYIFTPEDESVVLSSEDEAGIVERLAGLATGKYSIAMQDDD